jgi:hypothetical protein
MTAVELKRFLSRSPYRDELRGEQRRKNDNIKEIKNIRKKISEI